MRQSLFAIVLTVWVAVLLSACSSTKHIPEGQYLLRKNEIKLKTDKFLFNKGEIKDNLARLTYQRSNTYSLGMPTKLWWYNYRYKKLHDKPDSALSKKVERPVLLDTASISKSAFNMRSYLFNQGYFYATVKDTVIYKKKKAIVAYQVNAGQNYLINKINLIVDDKRIEELVSNNMDATKFIKNVPFTYSMVDEERSRLTTLIRNNGFYLFSQENLRFELDTLDKQFLKDIENPLSNAINFINAKSNKKPTLDIDVHIHATDDGDNIPFKIKHVTVFTDFDGNTNANDLHRNVLDGIEFLYHENYVHANIIKDRILLRPGSLYSQDEDDKTRVKLNELGIFQYIRIQLIESTKDSTIVCIVYLNKTKKLDISTNYEITSGTTYQLGNSIGLSFRNKNFEKGANLLMVGLTGGLELSYNDNQGKDFFDHFGLLTQYLGFNTSLDFPKFLAPISAKRFTNTNLPHTIITAGNNVVNRVQYFTLVNTSAGFKYNWRETKNKTWELSPAFINIIRLPRKSSDFQQRLDTNAFLRASYRETFIEGENIKFIFSDMDQKQGKNYYRIELGLEEAGGILGALNELGYQLNDMYKIKFAQYARFDFNVQRFINVKHSVLALRFYGGVGIPYGQLNVLPYIKQYFVGGPFSLRGWRIRSLGPGSYFDSTNLSSTNAIDRTGDIKLEMNGEYRFPIVPLFAGSVKMNGVLFADAGNIWLAKADSTYEGGEFRFNKLGQDIAMDVGLGSRFEIASFFTLRLDVAVPIKKPYVKTNTGWVLQDMAPFDPTWRANNVIVNFSIGYPF